MIAIVGSTDLWPTPEVVSAVAAAILATDEEIAIRATALGEVTTPVEMAVLQLCAKWNRPHVAFGPALVGGRGTVFERDYRLVESCRRVIAFFAPGAEMEGGTGHVVKAALDRAVEVEAFTLNDNGEVTLLGSHRPPWLGEDTSDPDVLLAMGGGNL